jgi:hypothetical protein
MYPGPGRARDSNSRLPNAEAFSGCIFLSDLIKTCPMTRLLEAEPAHEAQRCSEIRLNKVTLDAVKEWNTALKVCRYNGRPFPASLSKESYEYLAALLIQRQVDLA